MKVCLFNLIIQITNKYLYVNNQQRPITNTYTHNQQRRMTAGSMAPNRQWNQHYNNNSQWERDNWNYNDRGNQRYNDNIDPKNTENFQYREQQRPYRRETDNIHYQEQQRPNIQQTLSRILGSIEKMDTRVGHMEMRQMNNWRG